jgi:hypothetical protein
MCWSPLRALWWEMLSCPAELRLVWRTNKIRPWHL